MMPDQVRKWLRQESKDFYTAGFDALVKRFDKCISAGGGYVEKLMSCPGSNISVLRFISICDIFTGSPSYIDEGNVDRMTKLSIYIFPSYEGFNVNKFHNKSSSYRRNIKHITERERHVSELTNEIYVHWEMKRSVVSDVTRKWLSGKPCSESNMDKRLGMKIPGICVLRLKLRGFSPQANYTDRATAACRRS
jgi:hypothetical protein